MIEISTKHGKVNTSLAYRNSLRKILNLGAALCICMPALGLGYWQIKSTFENKIHFEGHLPLQEAADFLASGAAGVMWAMDDETAKEQVNAVMINPDFVSVTLTDQDGIVFASQQRATSPSDRLLLEEREIKYKGELIGHLKMALSVARIQRGLSRDLLKQVGTLLAQVGITYIFIWLLFERRVVGPLRSLQEGIARIARGDLKSRLKWRYHDEISSLAAGLDDMRKALAALMQERDQTIIELKVAQEVAEKANALKSQFLDIAAHELRTPVTAFTILVRMIQKLIEKDRPIELSTILRLRSQAERLSHLVVDLLEVSRLEHGLKLDLQPTDVSTLISECIADRKLSMPQREILFYKPQLIDPITLDPLRIFQVISNLIDNAMKYTAENNPIEITLESNSEIIKISVKDYGLGIPEDQLKTLFQPFTRGNNDLVNSSAGLGLGLYICRMIVELHEGKIHAVSEMNRGSTFTFELPIRDKII